MSEFLAEVYKRAKGNLFFRTGHAFSREPSVALQDPDTGDIHVVPASQPYAYDIGKRPVGQTLRAEEQGFSAFINAGQKLGVVRQSEREMLKAAIGLSVYSRLLETKQAQGGVAFLDFDAAFKDAVDRVPYDVISLMTTHSELLSHHAGPLRYGLFETENLNKVLYPDKMSVVTSGSGLVGSLTYISTLADIARKDLAGLEGANSAYVTEASIAHLQDEFLTKLRIVEQSYAAPKKRSETFLDFVREDVDRADFYNLPEDVQLAYEQSARLAYLTALLAHPELESLEEIDVALHEALIEKVGRSAFRFVDGRRVDGRLELVDERGILDWIRERKAVAGPYGRGAPAVGYVRKLAHAVALIEDELREIGPVDMTQARLYNLKVQLGQTLDRLSPEGPDQSAEVA